MSKVIKTSRRKYYPRLGIAGVVSLITYRYALTFLQFGMLGLFIGGNYASTNLNVNTSTTDMLSPHLDFRQAQISMHEVLEGRGDGIVIVVEGSSSTISHDAAAKVVERISQYPALFDHIFSTATEPFFMNNAMLYLDHDEVINVTDTLLEGQPILTILYRDTTLRGLFRAFDMTLTSLENRAIPVTETPLIDTLFGAVGESMRDHRQGASAYISWREHILGRSEARDERRIVIALKPTLDYSSLRPAEKAIGTLNEIIKEVSASYDKTLSIGLTGTVMLEQEEMESAVFGASLAGVIAFILVGWLVIRGLGNVRLFFATMLTLTLGLVETAAFAAWSVGRLNIISVAFAVLFIGIGVDFCIQFCLAFRESLRKNIKAEFAVIIAARQLRIPLLLATLTGAGGFLSFVPTDYIGLSELGIIAAGGLLIALINSFTLLPALLRFLKPAEGWRPYMLRHQKIKTGFPLLTPIIIHHDGRILTLALMGFLLSLTSFDKYYFDSDPFNLRDPNAPSMRLAQELIRNGRSQAYAASILAASPQEAQTIAHQMAKQDHVSHAETPAEFLPKNVDSKLDIVQDTSAIVLPALTHVAPPESETDESRLVQVRQFHNHLAKFLAPQEEWAWPGARKLLKILDETQKEGEREKQFLKSYAPIAITGLPRALHLVQASLSPNEKLVTKNLANLPTSIKSRYIDSQGRSVVTVYPHATATDDVKDLELFTDNVRTSNPRATGGSIMMVQGGRTVVLAFKQAGLLAVLFVFLTLLIALRNITDAFMVFIPLTIAAVMTMGVSVAIHIPLNYANLISLPLLFSLGVSYGIYLVWRRRSAHNVASLMNTVTPRAILYSALTTIASFGSLAISDHRGAASMGIMLVIALTLAIIASLILLPALMSIQDRWHLIRAKEPSLKKSLKILFLRKRAPKISIKY